MGKGVSTTTRGKITAAARKAPTKAAKQQSLVMQRGAENAKAKRVSIALSPEQYKFFDTRAIAQRRTLSSDIMLIIDQWWAENQGGTSPHN